MCFPDMLDNGQLILSARNRTKNGNSVLHFAAIGSSRNLSALLSKISSTTVINRRNYNGETPLHWACLRGSLKIVRILLQNGADINAKDKDFNTPLHFAAEGGKKSIVKFLLSCTNTIEFKNNQRKTPLHVACDNFQQGIIKILLRHGASCKSILPILIESSEIHIVTFMIKYTSDYTNDSQRNPLHLAVIYDNHQMAYKLIQRYPFLLQELDCKNKRPQDLLYEYSSESLRGLFGNNNKQKL